MNDATAGHHAHMVADGRIDVIGIGGNGQPLGEGVERANFGLAPARQ
jgi:hypothetical protein